MAVSFAFRGKSSAEAAREQVNANEHSAKGIRVYGSVTNVVTSTWRDGLYLSVWRESLQGEKGGYDTLRQPGDVTC